MFPFAETVTLHKRTGESEDDTGNEIPTYTDQCLAGASVWPNGSSETDIPLDVSTGALSVDFEGWPVIDALDEMSVWGDRYRLTGEPRQYRSPFTGMKRTSLQLLRRT